MKPKSCNFADVEGVGFWCRHSAGMYVFYRMAFYAGGYADFGVN